MTTTRSACYSRYRKHCKGTYRSGLEESVSDFLLAHKIDGKYEQHYLTYRVPESTHRYTPDFVLPNGIIIETKGVWDATDRQKHLLIREQYPQLDIRFVFTRSKSRLYKGSKTTYGTFCEKYGIKYADKQIPLEWLKEKKRVIPNGILLENNNKNNKKK